MGVRRFRKQNVVLRYVALLLTIPVLLTTISYALFSQNLSINATPSAPLYVSSQYLLFTYTKTITTVGSLKNYSIPVTVRNNGPTSVTAWQIKVDLPADFTNRTCPGTVSCSMSGNTLTIANGGGNGTIAKNATRTFTFSFRTAITDYTLQNVYVSGTYIAGFQTITGLTVGVAQGARSGTSPNFRWNVTFTVTNTSGFTLSAWQITVPWTTARSVVSMPAGVTYLVNGSSLLITSTQPITNGSTYVFTPTLGSTSQNWTVRATIKGTP